MLDKAFSLEYININREKNQVKAGALDVERTIQRVRVLGTEEIE